jgi:hypothetical protein
MKLLFIGLIMFSLTGCAQLAKEAAAFNAAYKPIGTQCMAMRVGMATHVQCF